MGTLYNELQKWLRSPIPQKQRTTPQQLAQRIVQRDLGPPKFKILPKEGEVDHPVARVVPSAKSTTSVGATSVALQGILDQQPGGSRRNSVPAYGPGYLSGQYALDVATMAKIEVQSLAYPTGKSPSLLPWALRFSPEQAYIDLGRLSPWDQWKILWTRVGAHYFQDNLNGENA